MANLPNETAAQMRARAAIGESDVAAARSFVDSLSKSGQALDGKKVVNLSAKASKQLWTAGEAGSPVSFNPATLKYFNGSTQITATQIKAACNAAVSDARFRVLDATLKLQQGKLPLNEWYEARELLKQLHLANSALARGGWEQMTPADYKKAESIVARQFTYWRGMAEDVERGRYGQVGGELTSGVLNRAGMYGDAGRATYENTVVDNARDRLGHDKARRILGAVDHCSGCIAAADEGWVDVDDVLPIGDAECGVRCHCIIITGNDGNLID